MGLGPLYISGGLCIYQADCACLTGSRRVLQDGRTALHCAAVAGKVAAIQALLAAKADVHAKNNVRGGGGPGRARRRRSGV